MRNWTFAVVAAAIGIGAGWLLRGRPAETVRVVAVPPKKVAVLPDAPEPKFPEFPKPPVEQPTPIFDETSQVPPPLVGSFPKLPATGPGSLSGPLSPDVPPATGPDLNADEALARRIVLQAGAEIVSSSDAKDSLGKVGRMLVAETDAAGGEKLRAALRKELGDRAILSDGGTVGGTSAAIRKAEEALEIARKERDKARVDFLPEAPALRQIEDAYLAQERALAEMRKAVARLRLTILLRPTLGA